VAPAAFSVLNSNVSSREVFIQKCDVIIWKDQLALYEEDIKKFGSNDIAVYDRRTCALRAIHGLPAGATAADALQFASLSHPQASCSSIETLPVI
jgi:hypothetical protein